MGTWQDYNFKNIRWDLMKGRIFLGCFFLLLGGSIILHHSQIIDVVEVISIGWPFIFVIIGLIQFANRTYSSIIVGFLFFLTGVLFLANKWYDLNLFPYALPLIFIVIGFMIIFRRKKHDKIAHSTENLHSFVLLGATDMKSRSNNLKGGSIVNILGGSEIDLRDTVISDKTTIDLNCFLGGVTVIVPENVRLNISGIPILGAWEDLSKNDRHDIDDLELKVNCLVVLGGVEFRN